MTQIPVNTLPREEQHIHLLPLGDEMPYDFKRPHRHDYFEFFIFEEGGGSHFIDFEEYPIVPRSIHVVFPNQIHLLKRQGAKGRIVICRKDFMNILNRVFYTQLYQHHFTHPSIMAGEDHFSAIRQTITALQQELEQASVYSSELIKSYFSIFLSKCIQPPSQEQPVSGNAHMHELELYRKFVVLLEDHFMEKQTVTFYANELLVTPKVLNNHVRKVTGKTCVDLVQDRTLTEAKRLLLFTDQTSKEIAFALNFKDSSYFTRFFTRQEGQTPQAFRQYWEEKYHS